LKTSEQRLPNLTSKTWSLFKLKFIWNNALPLFGLILFSLQAQGNIRLLESYSHPRLAARGYTGVAGCSSIECLDANPAFLSQPDESVNITLSLGLRFNEAIYDILDNLEQTKALFSSSNYKSKLVAIWDIFSSQTGKYDLGFGVQVKGFSFRYSNNFGITVLAHDPVLPYADINLYAITNFTGGYGHSIVTNHAFIHKISLGVALKFSYGEGTHHRFNNSKELINTKKTDSAKWVTGRIGSAFHLVSDRNIILSAVITGIPIYKSPMEQYPNNNYFDLQPGIGIDLYNNSWTNIRGYYSLSRITRQESFLLKNHIGIVGSIGKFQLSTGLNESMLSYGIQLTFPVFTVSIASYGIEYSTLANNFTDRIYWFQLEIMI